MVNRSTDGEPAIVDDHRPNDPADNTGLSDEQIDPTDGRPRLRHSQPQRGSGDDASQPDAEAERRARVEAARARMRRVPVRRPTERTAPADSPREAPVDHGQADPPSSAPASEQIDALLAGDLDDAATPPPVPQAPMQRGFRRPLPPEQAPPPAAASGDDESNPIMAAFEARLQDEAEPPPPEPQPAPPPPLEPEQPAVERPWGGWFARETEDAGRPAPDEAADGAPGEAAPGDDDLADDDLTDEDITGLLGTASGDLEHDPTEEQFEPFVPPPSVYTRGGFAAQRRADIEADQATEPLTPARAFREDDLYDDEPDDEFAPDDDEWLELLSDEAIVEEQAAADFEAQRATESRQKRHRMRTAVRDVVEMILLGLLVFLVVKASVHRYRVEGDSMFPTIHDGQQFLVNKLSYAEVDVESIPFIEPGDDPTRDVFGAPNRGDVIVFHDPRGTNQDLIKRVIGLPGETVSVQDGVVYINGFALIEDYIVDPTRRNTDPVTVPEGHFFVMGDNRNNSTDSRVIGPVPRELIVGRTVASVWPREDIGFAPNERPECEVVPSCQPEDAAAASANR